MTIEAFFNSVAHMPSLPKVVHEVMQMLADDNVEVSALALVVQRDAVIAAKVLKMANSSYYGLTRTIKTIDDAIAILGLSKLKTLVIASGVLGTVTHVDNLDLKAFWRHSLVTASVSRDLATYFKQDAEMAYIAGLLHNIGGLLIHMVHPETSLEIDALCEGMSADKRQFIERQLIGVDHCEISEALANRWNFPSDLSRVLRDYATALDKGASDMAAIVYLAVNIAYRLQHGDTAQMIAESLDAETADAANTNVQLVKRLGGGNVDWIARMMSFESFVQEAEALL